MEAREPGSPAERLFAIAHDWMEAEERVRELDQAGPWEARARALSEGYETAVTTATMEELEAAGDLAVDARSSRDAGSAEWLELDTVVRLLSVEALARAQVSR